MSAPGPWVGDLDADGIAHAAVPSIERQWSPGRDVVALVSLVRALRRQRPIILHTHTPKVRILGPIAARLARVPIVVNTFHGVIWVDWPRRRRAPILFFERTAARLVDFELCQSGEDLDLLRGLGVVQRTRSARLGNGVNLQTFDPDRISGPAVRRRLGIPQGAIVVGTVGRLVWEKGYREFFAMAQRLRRDLPDVTVVAIGPNEPGVPDAVPSHVIQTLEHTHTVRFLGMRTDIPDLLAAMDVFVLPSHREGFPRSAVEAATMGRPLVLTDIRGCREVVRDGVNGFLVPPGDPESLWDRVRLLIQDRELRARFGKESRRIALAEFNEARVISATLEIYRRLLREKGLPHEATVG
jgi:glycosyltransferase involved in cell wall biosynthesis